LLGLSLCLLDTFPTIDDPKFTRLVSISNEFWILGGVVIEEIMDKDGMIFKAFKFAFSFINF
jgi:hypothetical protein